MQGLMMDRPLLTASILQHAERTYGDVEIVARETDGSLFCYTYRDMAQRARQLDRGGRANSDGRVSGMPGA
ncbi:hypothetical protein D1006_39295 [Burkholderia stabilis]|uniref:AMP-dependent synthetase/ligase domain-containing protein n=1 Tax=Burkholderia stabilis TaxID=95485 RepID=A0A4Q2A553_9BURK|nr:hypothetical protein D1006_39295 [Burkholderia stabilis]